MPSSRRQRRMTKIAAVPDILLAPAVIGFRLPILAAEAMATDGRYTETTKAVAEKAAAVAEGMFAAQMSFMTSMWSFWPEAASGKLPSLMSGQAVQQATEAAMRPVNKRVRANFRRLSRS